MPIIQFWFSDAIQAWLFADDATGELLLASKDCEEINTCFSGCRLKYIREQCDMQIDWCDD